MNKYFPTLIVIMLLLVYGVQGAYSTIILQPSSAVEIRQGEIVTSSNKEGGSDWYATNITTGRARNLFKLSGEVQLFDYSEFSDTLFLLFSNQTVIEVNLGGDIVQSIELDDPLLHFVRYNNTNYLGILVTGELVWFDLLLDTIAVSDTLIDTVQNSAISGVSSTSQSIYLISESGELFILDLDSMETERYQLIPPDGSSTYFFGAGQVEDGILYVTYRGVGETRAYFIAASKLSEGENVISDVLVSSENKIPDTPSSELYGFLIPVILVGVGITGVLVYRKRRKE